VSGVNLERVNGTEHLTGHAAGPCRSNITTIKTLLVVMYRVVTGVTPVMVMIRVVLMHTVSRRFSRR
jgi:hypothetical protein